MDSDLKTRWIEHVRFVLDSVMSRKKQAWVSFNAENGFQGYPGKVNDDIYTITTPKGGCYHFLVSDVKMVFDAGVAAPTEEKVPQGKN